MNIFKNTKTSEYKEKQRYKLRKARIWGYKIGKRYSIGEKIAKANTWANGHRRKAAGMLFGVNAAIYLIGFLFCFTGEQSNTLRDPMQDFAEIQPMFAQLHRIEDMKQVEKATIVKLGNRVVNLKHEVDSLMEKPGKTHQDSVLALQKYDELQAIMGK